MTRYKELKRQHLDDQAAIRELGELAKKKQAALDKARAEADSWRRVAMDTMRALQEAEHSLRQITTRCQAAESAYQTATAKLKNLTA